MHVVAIRKSDCPADDGTRILTGQAALHELLAASDYIVLAAPSTASTRHLIGPAEFDAMRREAVLINIARGNLIDEDALIHALGSGRIRGAGLDVFTQEPLPADSPLWAMRNVLILPHVSSTTRAFWRREADLILHNMQAYFAGQPLRNVVNKHAGY